MVNCILNIFGGAVAVFQGTRTDWCGVGAANEALSSQGQVCPPLDPCPLLVRWLHGHAGHRLDLDFMLQKLATVCLLLLCFILYCTLSRLNTSEHIPLLVVQFCVGVHTTQVAPSKYRRKRRLKNLFDVE